jgi:3-hydroxyacyl-CoA dehydrogenase
MSEAVSSSIVDDIAVVMVDQPPVNAIDQAVRKGLLREFSILRSRPNVKAIVLGCAGKTFIAGADIKEFDSGIGPPGYHEVFRLIEDSSVPVVAAIHGTALGAGTEIALACHYRVATKMRAWVCQNFRSGSSLAPAARSACRGSSQSPPPLT